MADLHTIITLTQDELKKQLPTEQAVAKALETLKPREAEVVRRRYGLGDQPAATLQEIGAEVGITRERVRQIEQQGLKKFQLELANGPLAAIIRLATSLIRQHGGVLAAESFYDRFLPVNQQTPASRKTLSFLLDQVTELRFVPARGHFAPHYAISAAHEHALAQAAPALVEALAQAKRPLDTAALLDALTKADASDGIGYLITEPFIESVLEIGADFVDAPGNLWGLADWPEINPRNIREKTLFVLRKHGTPLHFKDIAEHIKQAHFDDKRVTPQAVHNELINGDEFVLIGRGIYALRDWGYQPGTVADVIRTVLEKSDAPMDRESIVSEVLKQRHVSRNTILINLQEKDSFRRVDKHSYTVLGDGADGTAEER